MPHIFYYGPDLTMSAPHEGTDEQKLHVAVEVLFSYKTYFYFSLFNRFVEYHV